MYVCSRCGRTFDRKKPFPDDLILCNGCLISKRKKEEFQKEEKKQHFLDSTRNTCNKLYGCSNNAQRPDVKAKHAHKGGFANPAYQDKIQKAAHSENSYRKREKTCTERYGATHFMKTKEGVSKIQQSLLEKTGFRNPMQDPAAVKNHLKGYIYNNEHFDSSWELAYYIYLRDNQKEFTYHPDPYIPYIDSEGVERFYQPDFLVEGQLHEIKGDQFFNEKNEPYNSYTKTFWWEKYNILLANNVKILKLEDIKFYLRYVKEKYGKDYLKQFKVKFNDHRNTSKNN